MKIMALKQQTVLANLCRMSLEDPARKKLDEEMKRLEERMTARRARLQQKLSRTTVLGTQQAITQPAETRYDGNSQVEPAPPTQAHQPSRQPPDMEDNSQSPRNQLHKPHTQTRWKTSSSNASEYSTEPRNEQQIEGSQIHNLAHQITEHMHISLLAPPEPSVFTGNPLEYADWRVSFDSLIDAKRGSPMEKLHRLKKYVDGDAKEAISGYFRLQTAYAYQEALGILHEEFGREDLVENSFRDNLEQWLKLANKDHDALKKYSYFLRQCLAAQKAMPNLQALDDKRENRKFIKVLPTWLVNRWTSQQANNVYVTLANVHLM